MYILQHVHVTHIHVYIDETCITTTVNLTSIVHIIIIISIHHTTNAGEYCDSNIHVSYMWRVKSTCNIIIIDARRPINHWV